MKMMILMMIHSSRIRAVGTGATFQLECVAISKQWVTAVKYCEYTVTLLRMTLTIGHRGFQPALVKLVTLLYFFTFTFTF